MSPVSAWGQRAGMIGPGGTVYAFETLAELGPGAFVAILRPRSAPPLTEAEREAERVRAVQAIRDHYGRPSA